MMNRLIETETELEDLLSAPNAADIEVARRAPGDVLILGAGGKMGPSLARRIKRASEKASVERRVIAASRFSSVGARRDLESAGVETISCDLLDRDQIARLPECENLFFLAGRKFGSQERPDLTWAINVFLPGLVAEHFRASRTVVFSTGNVYPVVEAGSRGAVESDLPAPCGEYGQSCLGRERIFEYFSREAGTRALIFRLNYAVDLRYGVLLDIARRVHAREPVNLTVPFFNVIWQGDANSYAWRCIELCESPPRILNVTGPAAISTRGTAEFMARRLGCMAIFEGEELRAALLSDASLCYRLLGRPSVSTDELMEWVAHWVEIGGRQLDKPTRFEVVDGRY